MNPSDLYACPPKGASDIAEQGGEVSKGMIKQIFRHLTKWVGGAENRSKRLDIVEVSVSRDHKSGCKDSVLKSRATPIQNRILRSG